MTLGWPLLFYGKVKFSPQVLRMEKAEKLIFFYTLKLFDMEMQSELIPFKF